MNIIASNVFVKMLKRKFWLHWNFWMSPLKPRYAQVVKDKNLIIFIIWGSQILSNDFKVLFLSPSGTFKAYQRDVCSYYLMLNHLIRKLVVLFFFYCQTNFIMNSSFLWVGHFRRMTKNWKREGCSFIFN